MPSFSSLSPLDGASLGRFPLSGPEEAAQALDLARRAFSRWGALSVALRARHLEAVRREMAVSAEALARTVTQEIGKPLAEALSADVLAALEGLKVLVRSGPRWIAPRREARSLLDGLRGVRRREALREPLGVIGIIGTWNYPLAINVLQIGSALLAGNTVLWKPSELSPASAAAVENVFRRAGIPEGVLGLLHGDGGAGEALCRCGAQKILFTGSAAAGRKVHSAAASAGTPVVLETSGLDAALVLADADLPRAARALAWGAFTNAGQTCVGVRRIFAEASVYPAFLERLAEAARGLKLGDPMDPGTEIGPLRAESVAARLEALIGDAVRRGARIVAGGRRSGRLHFEPTVLAEVPAEARVLSEEHFGPVAAVLPGTDLENMIRRANEGPYGLAASIWTRRLPEARRIARGLEVGTVWINDVVVGAGDVRAPFGGVKGSGFGRVHGPEGLAELTRVKWVETASPRGLRPYYFPYGASALRRLSSFLRWRHL